MDALEKRLATVVEIYRRGIWIRPCNHVFLRQMIQYQIMDPEVEGRSEYRCITNTSIDFLPRRRRPSALAR